MADNHLLGDAYNFIANVPTLTPACQFGSHDFNPPTMWMPTGHHPTMTALKWITAALVAMLAFPAFVLPSLATGRSHLGNPG